MSGVGEVGSNVSAWEIASSRDGNAADGEAGTAGQNSLEEPRRPLRFADFYRDYGHYPPPFSPGERLVHEQRDVDFAGPRALEEASSEAENIGLTSDDRGGPLDAVRDFFVDLVGQEPPRERGEPVDIAIDLPPDLPFVAEATRDAIDYYRTFTNVDLNLIDMPADPEAHDSELIVVSAVDDWSGLPTGGAAPNAAMFGTADVGRLYVRPERNDEIATDIELGKYIPPDNASTYGRLPPGSEEAVWLQTMLHELGHRFGSRTTSAHVPSSERTSIMNPGVSPSELFAGEGNRGLVFTREELRDINEYTRAGGYRDTFGPLRYPSDGKTLPALENDYEVVDGQFVETLPFGIDPVVGARGDPEGPSAFTGALDLSPDVLAGTGSPIDPSVFTDGTEGGGYELWTGGEPTDADGSEAAVDASAFAQVADTASEPIDGTEGWRLGFAGDAGPDPFALPDGSIDPDVFTAADGYASRSD